MSAPVRRGFWGWLPGPGWGPGVLLFVLGVYVLTMSGHTYSPDEETMLEASRSLVERGTWAMAPSGSMVQVEGVDGQEYSQYGPGQSLAAVPWVAVGKVVGGLFPKDQAGYPLRLVLGSYNALIGASIVALFAALGVALGYSRRASLIGALALGFGTYLWPHSRTFFSEPLTGLGLFGSFYLLVREKGKGGEKRGGVAWVMIGAGALFALAVATKVQYVVALPAFVLYLGWWVWEVRGKSLGNGLRVAGLWVVGLIVGLVPLMWYNLAVFGSPFSTGYGADPGSTLTNPLGEGVVGLLVSPGKGILWYALPLVVAVWSGWRFARKHGAEAAFVVVVSVPVVVLFALYSFWHGDGSWGPRYLIPVLPFLLLPALPVIERVAGEGHGSSALLARVGLSAVLAVGFLVNMLGVLVNFDTYINVVGDLDARHWTVEGSPINGHLTLLDQRVEEWSARVFERGGSTLLRSGFSYSEGDKVKGEVLPRWTTGAGVMEVKLGGGEAVSMTLRLSDHRPPELARANVVILMDGVGVEVSKAGVGGAPVSTDYSFSVPVGGGVVTIQSDTWNPSELQDGGRNEVIGVRLESVSVSRGGVAVGSRLVEALAAPPFYPQPRWFYDPGTHHLADVWVVYMMESGMGKKAMGLLAAPFVLFGVLMVVFGLRGILRTK